MRRSEWTPDIHQAAVQKAVLKVSVTPAEHRDPAERDRIDRYAADQFAMLMAREGATALDEPDVRNTVSWFEHTEYRSLPRRWWHHLLFMNPVEAVLVPHSADGYHEGAVRYDLIYGVWLVVVPPEIADRVRGMWAGGLPHPIPPAIAYHQREDRSIT